MNIAYALRCGLLFCLVGAAMAAAAAKPVAPEINISDETQMPSDQLLALKQEYAGWARRVYQYLQVDQPEPVNLVLTRRTPVGLYLEDKLYMPPDDHDEMLETFVHEVSHQATGHDSSYFFKEGIATHTLEVLFLQDHRIPQGWPQYGVSNDAWIALFQRCHQLMPLQEALDWPRYNGRSADGDYRSWQVYMMGGSFAGWYIAQYGYAAFKQIFDSEKLPKPTAELERLWLASIAIKNLPAFDPGPQLPRGARYQGFAQHLKVPPPASPSTGGK